MYPGVYTLACRQGYAETVCDLYAHVLSHLRQAVGRSVPCVSRSGSNFSDQLRRGD